MKFRQLKLKLFFSLLVAFLLILLSSCGSGNNSPDDFASDTGALSFNIVYHGTADKRKPQAVVIDCVGEGVSTIEAVVYGSSDAPLQRGGPWECEVGQGTITAVPAGSGRTVVILGKDGDGGVVFRGEKSDIQVDANGENDAGTIECYAFVPSLLALADGSTVNADTMGFAWNAISGATEFHVLVSENSDLTNPIIDETATTENYSPAGLSNTLTYYWQVVAGDAYGNAGIKSQIWSFTVDAQHQNTPPVAQITSPTSNSAFTTNDNIAFAGNGMDSEDGNLSDHSLAWCSDVDGPIGTGVTFATNTLSVGAHQITLTATDSEGATGTATVAITVNATPANKPPVAQITNPTAGSTFTTEDNITFAGSGSDDEDGDLSGQSLVWRSDVDGQIGTGKTFASDTLSVGTHQIELTATDSDEATGTDRITITVNDLGPYGKWILDNVGDVGMYSTIAVEDGMILIGYYDQTNKRLKVARSLNDGYNWTRSTIESDDDMGKGSSIALDGNNVFLSTTIDNNRIGISVSNNMGDTWDTSRILPESTGTSNADYDEFTTSIAVDGQNIYITFLNSSVLHMKVLKSTYSANNWAIEDIKPPPDDFENGYYSSINEYNGTLYISHTGYSVADVYLTKISSTLANPTFSLVDEIGAQGDKGYTASAVRQVGNSIYIYVAYFDQSDGNNNLKFGRSVDGGDIFSSKIIDNSSAVIGKYPSMAISGDTIFVTYYDESNGNLKLARSSNHGDSWDIDSIDENTDDVGRFASLAVDGSKVYISYYDESNKNLKFAKSIDGGNTWE
jgi:hypothetical protein